MSPQTPPPSSSRILRVGMEKAAGSALALPLSVTGVSDEELSLDALIEGLDEDGLILGIEEGGVVVGIATLDLDFISAAVEMQTIGRLHNAKPAKRPVTNTDAALARPLVAALLANLAVVGAGTPVADWVAGCQPAGRLPAARAISLVLADVDYRICRLPCDLGVADRQGEVVLALPVRRGMIHHDVSALVEERQSVGWADSFTTAVLSAPAQLDAVIYRARVPLYRLEALQVGQVLPLAGADAAHVQIVAPGGLSVGAARLGQAAGMRAIRLEGRVQLALDEGVLTPRPAIAAAEPEKEQPPGDPGAKLAATG
ncbi:FliM/FliN family flagellar motor switch protein [Loktanella sp. IMCC34160]|uniref:FliM/FliN family flagellar motor switch protein n=1 Tax=Loktanella sp. IMCC34160 TaxID=2510646 RepID=UPI0013EB60BC|nr:FliM/FliN family flagellar motor switch protein [Loktanella sp. IMCC34160]